jgi:hypothetical protein
VAPRGRNKIFVSFKPRFGMAALSEPSVLYDYYNPEARAVVAPVKFVVKGDAEETAKAADAPKTSAISRGAR